AALVGADRRNLPCLSRLRRRNRFKLSILEPRQFACLVPDPQAALAILEQTRYAAALELWCIGIIKKDKPDSIESHQSAISPQPQVSVLRLHDRSHRIFRQALLRLPYVVKIMRRAKD